MGPNNIRLKAFEQKKIFIERKELASSQSAKEIIAAINERTILIEEIEGRGIGKIPFPRKAEIFKNLEMLEGFLQVPRNLKYVCALE